MKTTIKQRIILKELARPDTTASNIVDDFAELERAIDMARELLRTASSANFFDDQDRIDWQARCDEWLTTNGRYAQT